MVHIIRSMHLVAIFPTINTYLNRVVFDSNSRPISEANSSEISPTWELLEKNKQELCSALHGALEHLLNAHIDSVGNLVICQLENLY